MFKSIHSALFAACMALAPAWSHAAPGDQMSHSLAVTGAVKKPLTLTPADLRQLPLASGGKLDVTRHNGDRAESIVSYRGVLLRDILDQAVLDAPGHNDMKKLAIVATAT